MGRFFRLKMIEFNFKITAPEFFDKKTLFRVRGKLLVGPKFLPDSFDGITPQTTFYEFPRKQYDILELNWRISKNIGLFFQFSTTQLFWKMLKNM
jgi:hypothetical protein